MFIIAALISLFLMVLLSYFFAAQLVRPMEKMSRLTKQYSKGNFTERLEVKGAREQQELAESLNDMATSLSVIEDSRKSFIANVSHELKTPMTTIGGFVDGILDGTIPPAEERRYLGIVSSEIKRLARLVVTMLTLSKIEAGEESHHYSKTDMNQMLFNALLSFESAVDENGLQIEGFEDLPHIKVDADPELLFQVAYNLFDNAVKFSNKGGTIRVGMEEQEGRALVSISNTGKGIPEEEIHRIFERFYKVDKSRSEHVKGVGLGLNLARDIVELHGGDIYAESEPGGFTSFRFWIPIEKSTESQE
ncbi:MAG: HAMP domain-containing histidine kinase, partial [Clostridia bacterium]|nr:HAMP domain-containing histidine kinase [Clostridia bacterium]